MSDILQKIESLMLSGKKDDVKKVQRLLKSKGLYAGNIDGISKGGTNKALSQLRTEANAKKARESKLKAQELALKTAALNAKNEKAGREAKALAKKADNERKDKERSQKQIDAAVSVGTTVLSVGTSVAFGKGEIAKMNKLDAVAVSAKNRELKRYASQIDRIQNSKLKKHKTKAGNLTVNAKRQIGAIAKEAKVQGVTRYKAPIGVSNGALLAGKGVLLSVAASQMDNQYAKDGLNAVASGLYLAGAGVPAARYTMTKFGLNPLDGRAAAKIAEGKAIAKSAVSNTRAAKAVTATKAKAVKAVANTKAAKVAVKAGGNVVAFTGLKTAARFAGPLGLALTAGFALKAGYDSYKKTGSLVAASEAGIDSVTLGGYSLAKKYLGGTPSTKTASKAKAIKTSQIAKPPAVRSLAKSTKSTSLAQSTKSVKTSSVRVANLANRSDNGRVKGHYRKTPNGRVWIKAHKRAA